MTAATMVLARAHAQDHPFGTSHVSAGGPPDEVALEVAGFQARRAVDTAGAFKAGRAARPR
ncbi:MAG TPA: hypothetical protein VFO49_04625 [Nocardioides sp.]|nr:hypothetical protein [Nocardioides sp.]